jgi:hypothetical protein
MKGKGKLLFVALLVGSILSGCVFVPADGWYGERGHHGGYRDYSYHREWR